MVFSDGDVYDGEWKDGMRHGKGRMTYSDGDIYDGEWMEDKGHGQCTYIRHDGHKYVGGWGENGSCGQGTRSGIWDGSNLIQGSGVLRYDDGSWYDGEIRSNLRHGKGVYTLADGTVQTGLFVNDTFLGPET